ncbi:hypothetical protein F2Q69_00018622 [Brassica cretica]|uniref:Uncharacterized protein n=3 Tax=Brassica TaxID=3705 RepID=A0A8S9QB98_BRACR|nr:hypothetical protein F2Q69_00018622 [Brassica cretica]
MGSSPPPGVEPVSMTIDPQNPYQVSYLIRTSRINQLMKTIIILGLHLVLSSCCNGAGTTNVFSTSSPPKVQDHRSVQFWWFLPHRFPVPASGPSRRHNDIGLSTTSTRSSP